MFKVEETGSRDLGVRVSKVMTDPSMTPDPSIGFTEGNEDNEVLNHGWTRINTDFLRTDAFTNGNTLGN